MMSFAGCSSSSPFFGWSLGHGKIGSCNSHIRLESTAAPFLALGAVTDGCQSRFAYMGSVGLGFLRVWWRSGRLARVIEQHVVASAVPVARHSGIALKRRRLNIFWLFLSGCWDNWISSEVFVVLIRPWFHIRQPSYNKFRALFLVPIPAFRNARRTIVSVSQYVPVASQLWNHSWTRLSAWPTESSRDGPKSAIDLACSLLVELKLSND